MRSYLNYIEEAEFAIKLLSKFDLQGKRILEVGSGAGIFMSWLLLNGVDIIGIEPSALGFSFHQDVLTAILDYFNLPKERVFDLSAEQLDVAITGKFDLVYSINVMEHIPVKNLELAFSKMKYVLTETGVMYHHCPNYIIPFEPHYGVPLVPFFPQVVGKLKGIHKEDLWSSVNFITLPQVKKIAKKIDLDIDFKKNVMKETFTRLEFDQQFSSRHPMLVKVYKVLKAVKIIDLLGLIPPVLSTPMTYTLTVKNNAQLLSSTFVTQDAQAQQLKLEEL
ncbi:MAG: class I SAM-dependent methyltransferase [Flavipsychrobacter sp.]|nr:class I SAM-dependent methyltransferase [Flavipsychrobacter sp.]